MQHDVLQASVDTVSQIIDLVRLKGYTLVTLETCLYGTAASGVWLLEQVPRVVVPPPP